jgi:ribosomal protein S18 acetylase RimI-like enzyme
MSVTIEVATVVGDDIVEAFARLIPQLSRSSPPPTRTELQAIADHEACHLLIARDVDGSVMGSLTLVIFPIPTAVRAWIEDVVVDDAARGKGVGQALNLRALEISADHGAKTVDLTSRPSREAANRLYQRIGFEARDTNVYRFALSEQHKTI